MMKISTVEAGVKIYLQSPGSGGLNSLVPTVGQEYSVDTGTALFFSAVPSKDNYKTAFEISYKTTGKKDDDAPIWEKLQEHKEKVALLLSPGSEDSNTTLIIIIVVVSVFIVCIIVGCCVKRRLAKQHDQITKLH